MSITTDFEKALKEVVSEMHPDDRMALVKKLRGLGYGPTEINTIIPHHPQTTHFSNETFIRLNGVLNAVNKVKETFESEPWSETEKEQMLKIICDIENLQIKLKRESD